VPPQGFRCAANFCKKLYVHLSWLEKHNVLSSCNQNSKCKHVCMHTRARAHTHAHTPHTHTHTHVCHSLFYSVCYVFFSYACILKGQGFICRYIFMAIFSFIPPFHQMTFCDVPSCIFDKLGCAVCAKRLQNTVLEHLRFS
jgi:hypothetical protein